MPGTVSVRAKTHVAGQSMENLVERVREIPGSRGRRALARHCVPPYESNAYVGFYKCGVP